MAELFGQQTWTVEVCSRHGGLANHSLIHGMNLARYLNFDRPSPEVALLLVVLTFAICLASFQGISVSNMDFF